MSINNRGQVLWYMQKDDMRYWYLSTPVPEPSVLLLGLPVVIALRRRKR